MKKLVGPLVALVVVVAAAIALLTYLSDDSEETVLVLSELSGKVAIQGGPEDRDVQVGMPLESQDKVTTGTGSYAVLTIGGVTTIRIEPDSTVEVREVDEEGVQLELEEGLVKADVRPESGSVLRIGNRGREIAATDAELTMGVSDGTVVVESRRGDLETRGIGTGLLAQGQRATVLPSGESAIGAIPDDLLLDVTWPAEQKVVDQRTQLSGRTQAGARVLLRAAEQEVEVVADAAGAFSAWVPLEEGSNEVTVTARNALGEEVAVDQVVVRDTSPPEISGAIPFASPDGKPSPRSPGP